MRPRKHNLDLPQGVYLRHGSYYFVKKGRWINLGKDRAQAEKKALDMRGTETGHDKRIADLLAALEKTFRSRKGDAKSRGVVFEIELDQVLSMAKRQRWTCAVTGIKLNPKKPKGSRRSPFTPSIDRIIPSNGYVLGNVRVVCLAANFAMNEWGDDVLKKLAEGWLMKEFKRRFGQEVLSEL
jgi:hypothetical protein